MIFANYEVTCPNCGKPTTWAYWTQNENANTRFLEWYCRYCKNPVLDLNFISSVGQN